jgi:glycosyltransferase involved in cell wall biosynthesis
MTDAPEISVVIPTRNRFSLLTARALRSALEQQGVDHEIVVVDDGSTDGTAERLAALEEPRVRVVRRERSGGMAAARNTGIQAARGEWLALLDDDDVWSPRKLRVQLETARETGGGFVYSGSIAVDEAGHVLHTLYLPAPHELPEKLLQACVLPAGCSNVLVRTQIVRDLGGFDETLEHIADWDLWIRLCDVASGAMCDEILVAYLLHEGNMHVVSDPSPELDYLIEKHARAQPPKRISPDRVGYSRWVAGQRSRAGLHRQAARVYLREALSQRAPANVLRAVDALLAKRPSGLVRHLGGLRRRRPSPVDSPEWVRQYAG